MYSTVENKNIRTSVNTKKADDFAAIMLLKLGGKANYMRLMKLLYFAERYHIRRFMRSIAKDDILAMPKGMVTSYWLDILGESENLSILIQIKLKM